MKYNLIDYDTSRQCFNLKIFLLLYLKSTTNKNLEEISFVLGENLEVIKVYNEMLNEVEGENYEKN